MHAETIFQLILQKLEKYSGSVFVFTRLLCTQNFRRPVPPSAMNYRGPSPGSLLSFAVNDGYAEGILRGFKLGLLGQSDFANLSQCDVIDGTAPERFRGL